MKIGLLTVPFNNNYGGFLQAFALKTILVQLGHEVIIINRRRNRSNGLKARIKRFLVNLNLIEDRNAKIIEDLSIYTNQFKHNYLEPITKEYYTTSELKKCLKLGIDCFIVGSDQVWRYKYAKSSITDFYFSFLKGTTIKRFSYAASFGIDEMDYPYDILDECKLLLKDFESISVREMSGVDILQNHFGINENKIKFVLDPTMLLDTQVYTSLFDNRFVKPTKPFLFTYILDDNEEINELIQELQIVYNIDRIDLKAQTGDLSKMLPIAHVEEWLSKIYYSDIILTDSFHGTVFSILFNKPFWVYGNSTRGKSRFTSLLSIFGLEDRYIESKINFSVSKLSSKIDWVSVNKKLDLLKDESLSFLINSINDIHRIK